MRRRTSTNERGTALLEFSSALPFLLILLFGVFDIGRAVNLYLRTSRIAYEGVRYASSIAGLDEGTYTYGTTLPPMQEKLQQRIIGLFSSHDIQTEIAGFELETSFSKVPLEQGVVASQNIVTVEVAVPYTAFSSLYQGLVVRVRASGPYLYRDRS